VHLPGDHRRARGRRIIGVALGAILAASAAGCGIGAKQQEADRIHASRQKVAEHSPATGTVTYELEVSRSAMADLEPDERAQLAAAIGGAATGKPTIAIQVGLDGGGRRARASLAAPEGSLERTTVFADNEILVRRQNARSTERRTWAKLDIERIVENERPLDLREMTPANVLAAVASTVNPVFLVELTEGALAGSVERKGPDTVAGVAVTRYDANISFDKAMTELDFDDEEREVRLRLFRLLGASKDVVPARFWLDDEGRLRRLRVELEQRMTRQRTNTLVVTVELSAFGEDAPLDPPAPESIVSYDRFGRLVRAALPAEA
jgi:hypothetical protein